MLLPRHHAEQGDELRTLVLGEPRGELRLVLLGHRPDPVHRGQALIGEVERVRAPVGGVAPALDQAELFQLVHQEDHPGRVHPDHLGDGLLGPALVRGQPDEHPGVTLLQAQRGQPLAEPPRPVQPQLDEQEGQVIYRNDRGGGARLSTWLPAGAAGRIPLCGASRGVPRSVFHQAILSLSKKLATRDYLC